MGFQFFSKVEALFERDLQSAIYSNLEMINYWFDGHRVSSQYAFVTTFLVKSLIFGLDPPKVHIAN